MNMYRKKTSIKTQRKTFKNDEIYSVKMDEEPLHPNEQLHLTEDELKEEITRELTAVDPQAPDNIVRFDFKENQYKQVPRVEQVTVYFEVDGNMIDKSFEDEEAEFPSDTPDGENGEDMVKMSTDKPKKKLANQFNFCEHSTQTYNAVLKEFGCQTDVPARNTFSGNVTQWGIYDFYRADAANKKEYEGGKSIILNTNQMKQQSNKSDAEGYSGFLKPLKRMERMINQNTFDDVLHDFAYYEDLADEFRESEGTLLPLWKFSYEKAKKLAVTALCWSPQYSDLFAVGLNSDDPLKHSGGLICFYSLKNPSYPEYIFKTESGVLCLDIHPKYSFLICVGFYDGAVGVYKLNQKKLDPLYLSTVNSNKNTDPVWQVRWLYSNDESNLEFYSISSDGRISSWNIIKDDIVCYDILQMKTRGVNSEELGNLQAFSHECGTALEFHRKNAEIFLIATEEGMVHKCSRVYGPEYLSSFKAHSMAVYKLSWNYYHEDIFITCSADWTVKIWHQEKTDPLFVFDLGCPVGDVAWAPYSSTVFAAVTSDGYVHIYDLSINKYEPLCCQSILKRKYIKLTQIAFNSMHPVIICGNDGGQVISLKISPNLRKKPKERKGLEKPDPVKVEIDKMDGLLALIG